MASWQAHLMSFLLRHTFKRKLDTTDDINVLRTTMSSGRYRMPAGFDVRPDTIGGISGEWVCARGATPDVTLLYLHGGGYFACSPVTHRAVACAFAEAGMEVFLPDYRLAPEHPYPAAVLDARAAMDGLRQRLGSTGELVVAGDSAGGGLALAMMLADRDAGLPLPVAAALFSPWTDLAVTGKSIVANERRCAMFTANRIRRGAAIYLNGADPRDPLASPLYADLRGLPPMLVHASEDETLRDDSVRLVARARQHNVAAALQLWPAVPHVWQLFHPFVPEGRSSLSEAAVFLHDQVAAVAGEAQRAAAN